MALEVVIRGNVFRINDPDLSELGQQMEFDRSFVILEILAFAFKCINISFQKDFNNSL